MLFWKKKVTESVPPGFTAEDIRVESSICHGEKTIGFYSVQEKRLYNAELVTSEEDIKSFYRRYGAEYMG